MQAQPQVNTNNPSVRRILRAAGACFGQSGYDGTSLVEIARQAGVSKSLLHYHFASKEHLLLEVLLSVCRGFLDRLEDIARLDAGAIRDFEHALEQVFAFIEANIDQMGVMLDLRIISQKNPQTRARMAEFRAEVDALVLTGLTNVLGDMIHRLRMSPERLARMVLVQLQGVTMSLVYAENEAEREIVRETYDDIRRLFTRSIFQEVS